MTQGWCFSDALPDHLHGFDYLHQLYTAAEPGYTGRVLVPVLWDKRTRTIVSNESSEILRMLNSAFGPLATGDVDLYPAPLREEIDRVNAFVYDHINNGVYRCGFATEQGAYERAFERLFSALDRVEDDLGRKPFLVGEQPGNDEDLAGRPFVGPAGQLLDRALAAAGVARGDAYVTNVVKHFKWEPRGKRRIHARPGTLEIGACLPWLEAELAVVKPEVLVCLGATAAQALLGRSFRVSTQRGQWVASRLAPRLMATVHPSSILRAPDDDARRVEMERFVADLARIPPVLGREV